MNKLAHKFSKKAIIIVFLIILFLLILPFFISLFTYNYAFGIRYETPEWNKNNVSDFNNITLNTISFTSNMKQELTGYIYSSTKYDNPKGLIVMAHGLSGGGHNQYMPYATFFVDNGYTVFAYDITGNDKSEGKATGGLPQGIIDLDYALNYLKSTKQFENLPIMLFGHSWGGYSVANILNIHTDIKAITMVSGFNNSIEMIKNQGKNYFGTLIQIFSPYIKLYEKMKFGKYSDYSATDGFEHVATNVMIIHSENDSIVPFSEYENFYKKYKNNSRFEFIQFEDRGHNTILNSEKSRNYCRILKQKYNVSKDALPEPINKEKIDPAILKKIDLDLYNEIDTTVLSKITDFYNRSI